MSSGWPDFLDSLTGRYSSPLTFAFQWWHYNVPLLDRIRQTVPAPGSILEVGTGTGALSVFLAAQGYEVLGIDNDAQVIQRATALAEYFHVQCRFALADAFDLTQHAGKYDLAFSSGVIEHFPMEQGVRMLGQQARAARYVVVAVPTWHALKYDPMTEPSGARPIRLGALKRMCEQAELEILKEFGYGIPQGVFSAVYRHLLPHVAQWLLQNHLSYACTIGCIARSRTWKASPGA